METNLNEDKIFNEQEEFGKKIVEYCSQFKGDKYTIAMKSIEFGYQLAQEELETESIQEEKTSWNREELTKHSEDMLRTIAKLKDCKILTQYELKYVNDLEISVNQLLD